MKIGTSRTTLPQETLIVWVVLVRVVVQGFPTPKIVATRFIPSSIRDLTSSPSLTHSSWKAFRSSELWPRSGVWCSHVSQSDTKIHEGKFLPRVMYRINSITCWGVAQMVHLGKYEGIGVLGLCEMSSTQVWGATFRAKGIGLGMESDDQPEHLCGKPLV